jgi:hypothetical protein
MPRYSKRLKYLNELKAALEERDDFRNMRDSGVLSDDSMEDEIDVVLHLEYEEMKSRRYLFRSSYRNGKGNETLQDELGFQDKDKDELLWLNEEDFMQKYRMKRESFEKLVELIQDHSVFKAPTGSAWRGGRKQSPAKHQLACFLRYIGTEGSGASNAGMRQVFRFGRGTFPKFVHRCCTALRSLKDEVVTWPDEDERKQIAKRFFDDFGFPNCVGIADGTLFPFAFRPETDDAPDYKGRKLGYTLTCMVICDDRRFIRYYLTGWPGSVHDNRIFGMTKLARTPSLYFSPREYLLGDSAFENSPSMVSAYKNLPGPGGSLSLEQEKFNTCLGRARVISEHTIGLLKGRFPWLRHMRRVIKKTPKAKYEADFTVD